VSEETAQLIARARNIGFDLDEQFARLLLDEAGGDLDRVVCALKAASIYVSPHRGGRGDDQAAA